MNRLMKEEDRGTGRTTRQLRELVEAGGGTFVVWGGASRASLDYARRLLSTIDRPGHVAVVLRTVSDRAELEHLLIGKRPETDKTVFDHAWWERAPRDMTCYAEEWAKR